MCTMPPGFQRERRHRQFARRRRFVGALVRIRILAGGKQTFHNDGFLQDRAHSYDNNNNKNNATTILLHHVV